MAAQLHDSSRPVCFLLRLPPSVRRRIYLHLGVTRWDGLPMLFDLDGPVKRTWQVSFRGLLLSCRLIYGEASGLLFSSNRFVIHYRHVRGNGYDVEPSLQSLRNLTTTSLASLANLKIVLNQTSCHQRNEKEASGKCCDDIRHNGTRGTDYCRQHHTSHHDRPLRSSHSEAGPMLDEWFRTANYLSSRISPGTLRFSLHFKPAVSLNPFLESYGFGSWNIPTLSPLGRKFCGEEDRAGTDPPPKTVTQRTASHAALALRGTTDANSRGATTRNVLRNAPPPDAYAADGFAASHFLREIVPANCLGHLRFLELIFPPYNHLCWPHDGHPVLQDWIATVEWMKTALNTPGLALWMTMAGTVSRSPNRPEHRTELSQAQGDAVLAGYDRILQPLACLGGELGQFYADFAWPWKWTRWSLDMLQALSLESGPAWIKAKENVLDERAERSVLGNRYDRLCAHQGRFEMRPWREEHRIYDW
ncbi:predicted protein [Chaetomium globosum CBS 148.51]|uniref:F-box domain-containing protein n=1 Tax=Chaetomium globosum (strain ATCC 6205 / CBS 148.51 / DSM 1962 / NBRC 6347 / NRRL 1970) TaxID=306901 RepID=Q2GWX7_CHAGB|nr:uncharacterized protein CHGG_07527 [Chaetomium globosum CBS 148.51]EAQ86274.1 predicted protein [Chaetomium globosum CBS 148.51]